MIKQRTKKWYELKKRRIGGSEIFALVSYYNTKQQLENAGIYLDKFGDNSCYITAYQLYHKFKNPEIYTEPLFCKKLSKFGNRIEDYIFDLLKKDKNLECKRGRVIYDKDGENDIKVASLDIECKTNSKQILEDSNGNYISLPDSPNFIVECKAISSFKAQDKNIANIGIDYQYIFQLQYQLYCSGFDWGKIIAVSLFSDSEWERSEIANIPKKQAFKYIDEYSKRYEFIYKKRPEYIFLIENALEKFQFALKAGLEPELPNWENVFKKNYKLFYELVRQRMLLLKNENEVIETNKFDSFFSLKEQEKDIKNKLSAMGQEIRKVMLATGKACIQGKKGKIVMQSSFIKSQPNKNEE